MGKKSFSAGHLGRNHSERKEIIRTRVRSGTLGSDYIGLAPQVGLEPTTTRLTAGCSAIELLRNMVSGSDLSFRAVSSQVLSALESLTAVFGMGTGGTSPLLPPDFFILAPTGRAVKQVFHIFCTADEESIRLPARFRCRLTGRSCRWTGTGGSGAGRGHRTPAGGCPSRRSCPRP